MKDIAPILKTLGLIESEIKTYLSTLENGPGTVLDITKYTQLSRQATYVAIQSLTGRGLMSSVLREHKRYYAAEHPERLLAYARRREAKLKDYVRELERAIPELELKARGERPVVRLFEGKESIQAILADLQSSRPKELREIADVAALQKLISPEELQPHREVLKKMGVHVHAFYAGEPLPKTTSADRYQLPEQFGNFNASISIYKNKIAFVTLEGKVQSVIIESKPLARALTILFDLALRCANQFPRK